MTTSNLAFVESDHKWKLTDISKCEHKQIKEKSGIIIVIC